jgi:glucose-6-phosphate isomerase, archaeal
MNQVTAFVNWADGSLDVEGLHSSEKKLGELGQIFHDIEASRKLDPETPVYRVWWWEPVTAGTEGGLFWGVTEILPGRVGNEYFMTHGHRHQIGNRAEFYSTIVGTGRLLLRDDAGRTWCEEMSPGSLHYVPGNIAHRAINTDTIPLRFVACWPSDAGHSYDVANRFGVRIVEENGAPVVKYVSS